MEQLAFQYPTWFIFLCLVAGLVYAGGLYYRASTFRYTTDRTRWWLRGLSILRFVVVSVICFLLLSPFVRSRTTESEPPVIVMLEDGSSSIGEALSPTDSAELQASLANAAEALGNDYQVDRYTFGSSLTTGRAETYGEKVTDLGAAFTGLYDRYVNQNVGAVIVISDGVYNQGNNPLQAASLLSAPVYSIAIGDTLQPKDLQLQDVKHNSIAYLDDKLEVQLGIAAYNLSGEVSRLTVAHKQNDGEKIVHTETITIDRQKDWQTYSILLPMDAVGVQQYTITLSAIDGEASIANNTQRFFVDVLDSRQRILLLAHAPHPDITALRDALEGNKTYEVALVYTKEGITNPQQYDLALLHQLPVDPANDLGLVQQLKAANVPMWFITGSQTDWAAFNQAQSVVTISGTNGTFNTVQAVLNDAFTLFTIPEDLPRALTRYPPLRAPFGQFSTAADAVSLLTQQIGAVRTDYPLLTIQQSIDQRTAVLLGSGLWRWRLYHYLQYNNHTSIDEWLRKVVQYLAVKTDKRPFRVTLPTNIFNENEKVTLDAELYNAAFEPVNNVDVSIDILDDTDARFPFTFSPTARAYTLDAGFFPPGDYQYAATTVYNEKTLTATGQFSVRPVNVETQQTVADHRLLYQLAAQSGGALLYPDQLNELPPILSEREDIRPILHDTFSTQAIINLKAIFFLLVCLIGLEWFIRRYNGAY